MSEFFGLPAVPDGQIIWTYLEERQIQAEAVNSLLDVAAVCEHEHYRRWRYPYSRTDTARNKHTLKFLREGRPGDVLVMLDADHTHPADTVKRLGELARSGYPLVSALAFRRVNPGSDCAPDALIYDWDGEQKRMVLVREWERGRVRLCSFAGFGAIAIRHEVFTHLIGQGERPPFFRYPYHDDRDDTPSEDMRFGYMCRAAGIPWACDTSLVTPHLTWNTIDLSDYDAWPWAEYLALPAEERG